jgi:hypothetical protein
MTFCTLVRLASGSPILNSPCPLTTGVPVAKRCSTGAPPTAVGDTGAPAFACGEVGKDEAGEEAAEEEAEEGERSEGLAKPPEEAVGVVGEGGGKSFDLSMNDCE